MPEASPTPTPTTNPAVRGKLASYAFATIATVLLAHQAYSYDRRDEPLPVSVAMPYLVVIGAGLGVNISPDAIGSAIAKLIGKQ